METQSEFTKILSEPLNQTQSYLFNTASSAQDSKSLSSKNGSKSLFQLLLIVSSITFYGVHPTSLKSLKLLLSWTKNIFRLCFSALWNINYTMSNDIKFHSLSCRRDHVVEGVPTTDREWVWFTGVSPLMECHIVASPAQHQKQERKGEFEVFLLNYYGLLKDDLQ